jgi:hypothetical protein
MEITQYLLNQYLGFAKIKTLNRPFVTFFLDKKSNQKNQVHYRNSKVLLQTPSAQKKLVGCARLQTVFCFFRLHFCKT